MNISQREVGEVVVLDIDGKIMGGPDSETFQRTVDLLLADGKRNILINLKEVSWINSTGLGILIAGFTAVQKANGSLKLLHVSERIESLLRITKLSTIFVSFQEEAEAVKSFVPTS